MNTTVVLMFGLLVAVSLAVIVFSQMREKARIERARKVAALENGFNHSRRLFHEIPGHYLTPELKLLLLGRMEDVARKLNGFNTDKPVKAWLDEIEEHRQAVEAGADRHPTPSIDSKDKSAYIKDLLADLFKLIEYLHKSRQLSNAAAQRKLRHVLFLVHKTHADLHIFQARDFIRQNETRRAIHEYHLAMTELNKSRDNPVAAKTLETLRTHIKELEAVAADAGAQPSGESQRRLDQQWDNFFEDDHSWKKKADYDD
ncbi:hypothetical protein [Marinobacter sp. X15-166B]|uniref:hypothetical protein n=1 Tax=Marinobacter sp. X15-166B TaxID=1897620 RepID=UPI00085C9494|nr:hypothetical protein [Marinobacter sp. X15-166B]OEY67198.1 hypothetical protein BG841_12570 [Marinobacter sp. X15-166B]